MAVKEINGKNFSAEVEGSDLPVILDFWAEWCGPCRMMAPVFEELSREFDGKVKFAKVNTDKERELAARFAVQGIPSLVVTRKGEEVDRIVGFMPKGTLKEKINRVLTEIPIE